MVEEEEKKEKKETVVTEEEKEDATDSNLSSRNRSYLTMVRSPCDHRFPGVIQFALLPAWLLISIFA